MAVKSTTVSGADLEEIKANAEKCWMGGRSHVRSADRKKFGPEDQLVGQLGEYALAKFLGDAQVYFDRRALINESPWEGDGGSDFPGLQVDVKTTLMRKDRPPLQYNLVVRPRERHQDNLYVLALVPFLGDHECKVILVGYAHDTELPAHPESAGVFAGAFRMRADRLHDLSGLRERVGR